MPEGDAREHAVAEADADEHDADEHDADEPGVNDGVLRESLLCTRSRGFSARGGGLTERGQEFAPGEARGARRAGFKGIATHLTERRCEARPWIL